MDICIPRLGIGATEGHLVEWLVHDGDAVDKGTPLYVLETDKVENEIESPTAGTIRIVAGAQVNYPVGEVIARIE